MLFFVNVEYVDKSQRKDNLLKTSRNGPLSPLENLDQPTDTNCLCTCGGGLYNCAFAAKLFILSFYSLPPLQTYTTSSSQWLVPLLAGSAPFFFFSVVIPLLLSNRRQNAFFIDPF